MVGVERRSSSWEGESAYRKIFLLQEPHESGVWYVKSGPPAGQMNNKTKEPVVKGEDDVTLGWGSSL